MFNRNKLYSLLLVSGIGIAVGISSTVLLYLLNWATILREAHPQIIWLLPIGGFASGMLYHSWGRRIERGHNLVLDEIHDPQVTIPIRMWPMALVATGLTHIFGGSAGREGTAIQMGAALADRIAKIFRFIAIERKVILMVGIGAGFGSGVGAPFAGALFAMEVLTVSDIQLFAGVECLLASFIAFKTSHILSAPHMQLPHLDVSGFNSSHLYCAAIVGITCGAVSWCFITLTHYIENFYNRNHIKTWLRPVLGGLAILVFYYFFGSEKYSGLGFRTALMSLESPPTLNTPLLKLIASALTVGSGFKGGEFIPLVYIGTTLGSTLSRYLPEMPAFLGAIGFASAFAGASNTPLACTVLAVELFGPAIGPYAFVGCILSYFCSGQKRLYSGQRFPDSKIAVIKNFYNKIRAILPFSR